MKIQVNARNRAYEFEAAAGERLLYAGLASGIHVPYECGTGTCGTCKARLTAGEVEDLWPEAPGRAYLRQPGEFLMCQAAARGDASVEVADFVYAIDAGACLPSAVTGTLGKLRSLTHDVIAFSVDLTQEKDFDAGQFMAIELPGVPGYRGYSMVNFQRAARRFGAGDLDIVSEPFFADAHGKDRHGLALQRRDRLVEGRLRIVRAVADQHQARDRQSAQLVARAIERLAVVTAGAGERQITRRLDAIAVG